MNKKVPKATSTTYYAGRGIEQLGLNESEVTELAKEEWDLLPGPEKDRLRTRYRAEKKNFLGALDELNEVGTADYMADSRKKGKNGKGKNIERPQKSRKRPRKPAVVIAKGERN